MRVRQTSRRRESPKERPRRARLANAKAALEPLPLHHPAALIAVLAAAACIVVSVTFLLFESDFWQHLTVGRAIWALHRVPTTRLWTWPTYGAPDVNYAWGFEWAVWPFWRSGGVLGLFAWRWATTLAIFGALWAAARRMGARGLSTLVVLVLCALIYRQRSQIRPETLASVLLALEIWILETRRHGGPDRTPWLIPLAWVWANVHITYYVGFAVLGLHLLEAHRRTPSVRNPAQAHAGMESGSGSAVGPSARRLWVIGLIALAVSFLNPFGWRALWEPFRFVLQDRGEPLYRVIGELTPVDWKLNNTNGLAVVLVAWPLLAAWRGLRRGFDLIEVFSLLFFVGTGLAVQKFLGNLALVAAPYLCRDLDEWVRSRSWPRWTAWASARAALAMAACGLIMVPELMRTEPTPGVGMVWSSYPVAACEFMTSHQVGGRGFNHFRLAGYLLWKFWPDSTRLPFMDIHQAGTPEIRRLYLESLRTRAGWEEMNRRFAFDYALLARPQAPGDRLADFLDGDSTWALVFVDDAAALYLRRGGRMRELADRFGYRNLGAGREQLTRVSGAALLDSTLRGPVSSELRRQIASSPACALSHSFLANLLLADHRLDEAETQLDSALAIDSSTPEACLRLAMIALTRGQPGQAVHWIEMERRRGPPSTKVDLYLGVAYQQVGDLKRAAAAFRRVLRREPFNQRAREMLMTTERAAASGR